MVPKHQRIRTYTNIIIDLYQHLDAQKKLYDHLQTKCLQNLGSNSNANVDKGNYLYQGSRCSSNQSYIFYKSIRLRWPNSIILMGGQGKLLSSTYFVLRVLAYCWQPAVIMISRALLFILIRQPYTYTQYPQASSSKEKIKSELFVYYYLNSSCMHGHILYIILPYVHKSQSFI